MRAPIRATSSWGIKAHHRGTLTQLSTLTVVPARVYQNFFSAPRLFSLSTHKLQEQLRPEMGSQERNLDVLREYLTYEKLEALRSFWFEHLPQDADRIIAGPEYQKRWFFSDKQFDDTCVAHFSPILEAIRNAGVTSAQELLSIAQPRDSLDWLSLIILLDQIPRNSYRGDKASVCFTYFDPLAVQISLAAIAQGIPDQAPEIRWVFSHRNWFYMPLMHSEDLSAHDQAVAAFNRMNEDILSLTEGTGGANEYERRAREVVQEDPGKAKGIGEMNLKFEEKHRVIIERFGRKSTSPKKMVTTRASSRGASVGPEFAPEFHTELPTIPSTPSTRKRTIKTSSSTTTNGSAKKRRLSVEEPKKWRHTPSSATIFWLLVSLPLVAWDIGYVFGRPHTMPEGYLHWPLYIPYALYGQVDYIYGSKAFDAKNGFTAAQTALNVVESLMYIVYLFMVWRRADKPVDSKTKINKRTLSGRSGALAVVIGFSAAVMTLSKTVLYWANEYYSDFGNISHNTPFDILTLWVLPNGLWLILPTYMVRTFGKDIVDGLTIASGQAVKQRTE
ncbi:hypothetical protein FLONG3_6831 [Fusarium longipes]|uniref:Uncharacterized protein n=1 Tax=Fusarium longipes TaxID=694270 RepID=A0A395SJS1_9HYPO|nr:hypothetical protein FLONG3_6831 [Fusarium longipes]